MAGKFIFDTFAAAAAVISLGTLRVSWGVF